MTRSQSLPISTGPWDAIVVGTGIGGATVGLELARNGWRVLFCERGRQRRPGAGEGDYAECLASAMPVSDRSGLEVMLHAGRWEAPISDLSQSRGREFTPFIGSGAGGSSALYGMAMERLFPTNFSAAASTESGTVSPAWPIDYEELAPYYSRAESLYRVRGSVDPLRGDQPLLMPPPPMTPAAMALADHFSARGLHPYQLPSACEYVAGCRSCQGYLCPSPCKNDSWRIGLQPAVEQHGAALLDQCEVIRLQARGRSVTALDCLWQGQPVTLYGKAVILAAGALSTPALLLRSAGPGWPDGLANESGMVGRNLMRHLIDLYAIKVGDPGGLDNRRKEIAFNDFYDHDGARLGTVQSFGRLPPPPIIVKALQDQLASGPFRWSLPALRFAAPALRAYLGRLVDQRTTLATIVEDLPNPENRVMTSNTRPQGLAIRYRVAQADKHRVRRMRELMHQALAPLPFRRIDEADNNERIAHACGTCRFGDDPAVNVLDRNCRAHGVDNLYVVDSSFFPSSGGTNPSLTIAANALRVATHLAGPNARP